MFKFHTFVPASEIWPTAENHVDRGMAPGLVRGYCVEVKLSDGRTDWWSSEWIQGEPETEFNDDFHTWMWREHCVTPTGRICFRGYGVEEYDFEERDTFVNMIADTEAHAMIRL